MSKTILANFCPFSHFCSVSIAFLFNCNYRYRIVMDQAGASGSSKPKPSAYDEDYWIYARNETQLNNQTPVNCGKWMVFKPYSEIDEAWEVICMATEKGQLGHASKVSTQKPNGMRDGKQGVICIYTYDWKDEPDVMRVREQLRELGFTKKLPYKSDEDTMAGKYRKSGHKNISKYYC